jgi:hypothetical protein
MLAVLLTIALQTPSAVEEFYPMIPGTTWRYETESESKERTTDVALAPVSIGDHPCTVIETLMNGRPYAKTFYRVIDGALCIAAFDATKPLADPYPILKVSDRTVTWTFSGKTQFMGAHVPLALKGTSKPVGKRKIFDTPRDCIEVKLEAIMEGVEAANVVSTQTTIYARGIGMYEMREDVQVGRNKMKRKTTLIGFEAPKQ